MPRKKKNIKKKKMHVSPFLLAVLFVLVLFLVEISLKPGNISLKCLKAGDAIECQWMNCQLKADGSELILAKAPNYVSTMPVTEEAGSVLFSPYPLAGTYTVLLSCDNGELVRQIVIS